MLPKFENDAHAEQEQQGILGYPTTFPLSNNLDLINSISLLELETVPPTWKKTRKLPIQRQTAKDIIGAVDIIHHKLHGDSEETGIDFKDTRTTVQMSPRENRCTSGDEEYKSDEDREDLISESFSSGRQGKKTIKFCNDKHPGITRKSEKKTVQFHSLHIRTYNRVVGDHPCCTTGLPITLGWDYNDLTTVAIDEYETTRRPRKNRRDMRLDCDSRWQILSRDCEENLEGTVGSSKERCSEFELKRAGRKLHRERQRCAGRSRGSMSMVDRFFMTP